MQRTDGFYFEETCPMDNMKKIGTTQSNNKTKHTTITKTHIDHTLASKKPCESNEAQKKSETFVIPANPPPLPIESWMFSVFPWWGREVLLLAPCSVGDPLCRVQTIKVLSASKFCHLRSKFTVQPPIICKALLCISFVRRTSTLSFSRKNSLPN